jgi:CheY-like chemotaxis protein
MDGHEMRTVYSGEEAVEIFGHFIPDVVLLDLGLPGMSGIDVARHIRSTRAIQGVTLIAITGWGQPQDRARTAEAGFDFHFTKPVDASQLQRAINSAFAAAEPS